MVDRLDVQRRRIADVLAAELLDGAGLPPASALVARSSLLDPNAGPHEGCTMVVLDANQPVPEFEDGSPEPRPAARCG